MAPRQSRRQVAAGRTDDCHLRQEAAAVLTQNSEATDREIADAVNQWWQRQQRPEFEITTQQIAQIRHELGIAPTWRKPFQKRLFAP